MLLTNELPLAPRSVFGRGDSSRRGDAVEVGPQARMIRRASGAASRAPSAPSRAAWPSPRGDIEEVRLAAPLRPARFWFVCMLVCLPFALCLRYYETQTYNGLRGGVRLVPVERSTAAPAAVEVSSEAGSFTEDVAVTGAPSRAEAASISQSAAEAGVLAKDRVVTTAPRAALATLWRRVQDGVKRFAKRPRQSDSSITTRSGGKKRKTSGTEREKRARARADEAVDQARPKKRHRAARNAVTMMDIDVKSKKPTARPTPLPTPKPSTPTPTVSPQPTSAPTPVPSAVPTVSPKPSSSPTPAPSADPTVSPQPTVSPLPTSAPTITPGPTVSPQPTYWPWKRPCHLGPQRNERCTPTADQLHANVKRTEGVIAQSCDHRPDATLEEKNAAFQANVDKLTYVVATGVADSLRVRQNHFPSLYAPCRSIRTCPSRRRTGFLLIISISYSPTTCAARLHITNSHGPAANRSRSSLRCTTRPSWTT